MHPKFKKIVGNFGKFSVKTFLIKWFSPNDWQLDESEKNILSGGGI